MKLRNPWTRLLLAGASFDLEIAGHARALTDALTGLTYALGNLGVAARSNDAANEIALTKVRESVEAIDEAVRAFRQRLDRSPGPNRRALGLQPALDSVASAMCRLDTFVRGTDGGDAKECAAALRSWIVTIASVRDGLVRSTPRLLNRW